jgi:large subunit ribosomal protein L15e
MTSARQYLSDTLQSVTKGEQNSDYDFNQVYRDRMIDFRKVSDAVVRIERPTNLISARRLGYKAKKGIFIVRVRVRKGSGLHRRPYNGRKPKRMGVNRLTRKKSVQAIAEQRANSRFVNCEVLNSYWVGEDGHDKYFEVILVDPSAPEIVSDKRLNWLSHPSNHGRTSRGLTSAAKKSRGLLHKGRGTEKVRPGIRARQGKGK